MATGQAGLVLGRFVGWAASARREPELDQLVESSSPVQVQGWILSNLNQFIPGSGLVWCFIFA